MSESAIYHMARFTRGACMGLISAATLRQHGWMWMGVVVVAWASHLVIEFRLLSEHAA